MRLFIAIIYLALNSAFGFGQTAEFSVNKATHKFPKAKEGVLLTHEFIVTNSGNVPLVFKGYKVACECTKVYFPNKPIAPGQSDVIKVTFDTTGKSYFQDRIIYIESNAGKGTEKLRIKVNVEVD